jgi:hypothetical protein
VISAASSEDTQISGGRDREKRDRDIIEKKRERGIKEREREKQGIIMTESFKRFIPLE